MDRGLYIAASGMLAESIRQDQLANDLANASTPGYKADRTVTDWAPAPIEQTDQPLDLAIDGEGFFAVRTPQGVRYTRNGQFTTDARGLLLTAQGDEVLSQNGQPVQVVRGKVD